MDNKTISWLSYIPVVGWVIAYVRYNDSEKASLPRFHLRQSLGLHVTYLAIYVISLFVLYFLPLFLFKLLWILDVGLVVLWILGWVAALNGEEKPVPVLGEQYQKWFTFI
jgi:uncharacterized membrane protein